VGYRPDEDVHHAPERNVPQPKGNPLSSRKSFFFLLVDFHVGDIAAVEGCISSSET
jgi:hypothetical protein